MAATNFDLTDEKGKGRAAWTAGAEAFFIREADVDFGALAGGAGAAQNDTVDVMDIPAGTVVLGVYAEILKKEGGAGTIDVTGGAAVDGTDDFLSAVDCNAFTKTYSGTGWALANGAQIADAHVMAPAKGLGKLYTAAGTIKLLANAALDLTVVRLRVFCLKVA